MIRLSNRTARVISFSLWAFAVIVLLLKFVHLSLYEGGHSDRVVLFALPTAISNLYHNKSNNYTMYKELYYRSSNYRYSKYKSSFNVPFDELTNELRKPLSQKKDTQFWGYDDRGLADFIKFSFLIFGSKESSLFLLYFILIIISSLLMSYHYNGKTLFSLLPSIILLAISTAFVGYKYHQTPVTILHERSLGLLSLLPALHLAIHTITGQSSRRDIIILLAQAVILVFVYHCRSSNAWQVVAILAVGGAAFGIRTLPYLVQAKTAPSRGVWRAPLGALLPSVLVILSLLVLLAYQRAAFASQYFGEQGGRSFYHNALMGLAGSKPGQEWKLGVSDARVRMAVMRFLLAEKGLLPDENAWKTHWKVPFGREYEQDAKRLYWHIWRNNAASLIWHYIATKPLASVSLIRKVRYKRFKYGEKDASIGEINIDGNMVKIDKQISDHIIDQGYYYKIFGAPAVLALGFAAVVLLSAREKAEMAQLACLVGIAGLFFLLSLVPSVLFYNQAMRQLTVSLACLSFFAYATVLWAIVAAWNICNRIAAMWADRRAREASRVD